MSVLEIISIIENSGIYNNEIFLSILLFNENYIVNYYFKWNNSLFLVLSLQKIKYRLKGKREELKNSMQSCVYVDISSRQSKISLSTTKNNSWNES